VGDEGGTGRRGRAERLFGAPAERTTPRAPGPARPAAPRAVRRAALVVGVEAAALAAVAVALVVLTLTSTYGSLRLAVGTVLFALLGAALLAAVARGLWQVSAWARGPAVVLQLLLAVVGWSLAFPSGRPAVGVPVLVLVAAELFLLATPEARLAFDRR
jgi:hypothetical protein